MEQCSRQMVEADVKAKIIQKFTMLVHVDLLLYSTVSVVVCDLLFILSILCTYALSMRWENTLKSTY